MRIIETPVFTKQINRLLDEDTYKQFKEYLVCNPLKGKLIKGGIRIIYFIKTETKIYLLFAYSKSDAESITKKQINMLASFIKGL